MTYKAGDRFGLGINGLEFEVLDGMHALGYYYSCCVKGGNNFKIGDKASFNFHAPPWKYIGNFNKASNLTNLYDILNGV